MSSMRAAQIFKGLPDQLKKLGKYSFNVETAVIWNGSIATGPHAGLQAAVIDIDSATWADGNRRAILVAVPGEYLLPATMRTQSHSQGLFIDGSYSFRLYLETPEAWTDAQAQFGRILLHQLIGQNAAPCELFYGANDVAPNLEGVNGANAAAETASAFVSAGIQRPYGMSYAGGI